MAKSHTNSGRQDHGNKGSDESEFGNDETSIATVMIPETIKSGEKQNPSPFLLFAPPVHHPISLLSLSPHPPPPTKPPCPVSSALSTVLLYSITMKFPTAFLTVFLTLVIVNASTPHHDARSLGARHSRISAALPALQKKSTQKRCKNRKSPSGSSTQKSQPSSTSTKAPAEKTGTTKTVNNNSGGGGSSSGGVLTGSSKCGGSDAVAKTTKTSGPNGSIDFLNCGINAGGWTPPSINIKDVVVKPLSEAIKSSSSPFQACAPYVSFFNKYGDQFGVPPIFLASFAMQESSCQPGTVGGAGEQGLMQITKDKCGGAPGGNCRDPDFNIRTGAKFFADTLASNNGNVLESIGQYNGWFPGLTVGKATAARNTNCCRCQQNLDYLHQFLNGWCQNIDAYSAGLGKYFNLNVC